VLQKLLSKPDEPSYEKNIILVLLTGLFNHSYAQQANSKSTATNTVAKILPNLVFNPDENVVTEHNYQKGRKYLIKQRRVLCQFGMKMESDCGTILYLL
jgi:hypothetical protein